MNSKSTSSRLPAEIVERVLSFLLVPDLCRFRAVCKRWNSLICTPRFGNLCLQNANQDSYYIVGRYFGKTDHARSRREAGWCILDLNARRWYTFKGDPIDASDTLNPLAMDGGLVCQHVEDPDSVDFVITVSNPLAKNAKILPVPPCRPFTNHYPHVNSGVDSIFNTYKIFLINRLLLEMPPEDPIMRVFESTTNQWRSLANPPELLEDGEDFDAPGIGLGVSSVIFRGLLYVMFKSRDNIDYWLLVTTLWRISGRRLE